METFHGEFHFVTAYLRPVGASLARVHLAGGRLRFGHLIGARGGRGLRGDHGSCWFDEDCAALEDEIGLRGLWRLRSSL